MVEGGLPWSGWRPVEGEGGAGRWAGCGGLPSAQPIPSVKGDIFQEGHSQVRCLVEVLACVRVCACVCAHARVTVSCVSVGLGHRQEEEGLSDSKEIPLPAPAQVPWQPPPFRWPLSQRGEASAPPPLQVCRPHRGGGGCLGRAAWGRRRPALCAQRHRRRAPAGTGILNAEGSLGPIMRELMQE